jgi:hypothetical protein
MVAVTLQLAEVQGTHVVVVVSTSLGWVSSRWWAGDVLQELSGDRGGRKLVSKRAWALSGRRLVRSRVPVFTVHGVAARGPWSAYLCMHVCCNGARIVVLDAVNSASGML